jgi:hypothetical protein
MTSAELIAALSSLAPATDVVIRDNDQTFTVSTDPFRHLQMHTTHKTSVKAQP